MLDRILRGEDSNFPIILEPRGVVTRLSTDTMAISDHDVATALSFIRSNACGGIKVDDVAEGSPLTRRTLERRFQQLLGRTVNEEILRVRVGRVMQLLEDTDWSLDQIAEVSGFKRASYLSVAFTRETGRTPGDYRRECGKESRGRG